MPNSGFWVLNCWFWWLNCGVEQGAGEEGQQHRGPALLVRGRNFSLPIGLYGVRAPVVGREG
jgi:hypothetical protein